MIGVFMNVCELIFCLSNMCMSKFKIVYQYYKIHACIKICVYIYSKSNNYLYIYKNKNVYCEYSRIKVVAYVSYESIMYNQFPPKKDHSTDCAGLNIACVYFYFLIRVSIYQLVLFSYLIKLIYILFLLINLNKILYL